MTSDDKPNLAHPLQDAEPAEEVVPDYSRLGFRDLQQLVKARGMTADGRHAELIEKLKAWDAERGREPDLTIPADDGDEVDLLADDDTDTTAHTPEPADSPDHAQAAPETQSTPETPSGGGEAASASPPDGTVTITHPLGTGTLTAASPATVIISAPGQLEGLPPALIRGRPNMAAKNGVVRVGEGHGAAEVRAFRQEWPLGPRDITDTDHARFLADTHAAAWAAGHETKGGVTIGERIGYSTDAHGARTVIYQVPMRRKR